MSRDGGSRFGSEVSGKGQVFFDDDVIQQAIDWERQRQTGTDGVDYSASVSAPIYQYGNGTNRNRKVSKSDFWNRKNLVTAPLARGILLVCETEVECRCDTHGD